VAPNTADQQARAVLFRGRERLVHQRTELVNAQRAVLFEFGHVFPIGLGHVKHIATVVEDPGCDLLALVIAECRVLLAQIAEKTERIEAKTKALKNSTEHSGTARRLLTMPGVDTDTLDVTLDIERLGLIASIPLLEIRR
jgi:transposase